MGARRSFRFHRWCIGEMDRDDGRVNPVHEGDERRVAVFARVWERVGEQFADRSRVRPHDDDPVAQEDRLLDEMRDEEHPLEPEVAARPQPVDLRAQGFRRQHVERRERLVHAEQLGSAHERAGDADALLHAPGQLLRVRFLEPFEPHEIDDAAEALCGFGSADRGSVEADADVLRHREPGVEGEALEDDGGSAMHGVEGCAMAEDFAAGWGDEARHDAQQRRFAAPGGTEHDRDLARLDREAHVAQHHEVVPVALEAMGHSPDLHERAAARRRADRRIVRHRVLRVAVKTLLYPASPFGSMSEKPVRTGRSGQVRSSVRWRVLAAR